MELRKNKINSVFTTVVILFICVAVSVSVLLSRIITYTQAKFVNVMPLADIGNTSNTVSMITYDDGQNNGKHPEFRMEAEVDIFKFSYDETGKVTVIGPEGNEDKLIAPGTNNLYQFTLKNPGDTSLDYHMEVEAFITGTEEYLPVNARMWDYQNNYLVGSRDEMPHVLELDGVGDDGELGAGRYAVYNLEWQWPFEWGDDEHDTMLGNTAVDEDLVLHIVIRTVAEFDEEPEDPNAGLIKPPQTGDDSQMALLIVLVVGSFAGFCAMLIAFLKSGRKSKQETIE